MKKTIVTLLALAGVAAAADSTSITLPGQDDAHWIAGSNASGITGSSLTAENIQQLAAFLVSKEPGKGNTDLTGWFYGTGQGYASDSDYGVDISISSANSFQFMTRPRLSDEYVALGISLGEEASSITLTFVNDKKVGYSLWSYDATSKTATQLIGYTTPEASTVKEPVKVTYDTAEVKPSQLFVVWSSAPGNGTTLVSNIGLSYTPAIPEPATATLSLLALTGLAVRRRRR